MSCSSHGHLFCKECAISNLLAQSQELKRLRKEAERRKLEDADEKDLEDVVAEARAVEEFERVQAGLGAMRGASGVAQSSGLQQLPNDLKRKAENGDDEPVQLASEERGKARRSTADCSEELPSFWAPSETPDNRKGDIKAIKAQPTCPAASVDKPHEFSLKGLVTLHFSELKSANDLETRTWVCPSCDKALSNSTKAILAKPCGHVLCKPCSDKFQKPAEKSAHDAEHDATVRCHVCQEDVTSGRQLRRKRNADGDKEKGSKVERGLVELSSDGTGFAGGGANMVKKQGVAFQC